LAWEFLRRGIKRPWIHEILASYCPIIIVPALVLMISFELASNDGYRADIEGGRDVGRSSGGHFHQPGRRRDKANSAFICKDRGKVEDQFSQRPTFKRNILYRVCLWCPEGKGAPYVEDAAGRLMPARQEDLLLLWEKAWVNKGGDVNREQVL